MLLHRPWPNVWRSIWPWVAVTVPFAVLAKVVQSGAGIPTPPLWQRPIVMGASLAFYLEKLFAPVRLAFDYGWRPLVMVQKTWFWVIALIPLAIALALWIFRKRWPWLAAGGLVTVAALLPVLGLVPFSFQYFSTVADHYLYLAMLGPAIALAWVIATLALKVQGIFTVFLALALGSLTFHELSYWRDEETTLRRILQITPDSVLGHNGYGKLHLRRGELAAAEESFKRAVACNAEFIPPHENLLNLYRGEGRVDEAIAQVHELIGIHKTLPPEIRQDQTPLLLESAVLTMTQKHYAQAVRYLEEYLKYHPENGDARKLLEKARASPEPRASATGRATRP
jgi:tetratricopeptide (TPR) repeat protein